MEKEEEKSAIHFHSFIRFVYTHNTYSLSSRAHIEKLARRPPPRAPRAAPTAHRERERKKKGRRLRRPLNTTQRRGKRGVSLCTSLSNCLSSTISTHLRESGTSNERTTRRVLVRVLVLRKRWSESSTTRLSFVRSFVAKTTSWRESIFVLSHCFVAVGRSRGVIGGEKRGVVAR